MRRKQTGVSADVEGVGKRKKGIEKAVRSIPQSKIVSLKSAKEHILTLVRDQGGARTTASTVIDEHKAELPAAQQTPALEAAQ